MSLSNNTKMNHSHDNALPHNAFTQT